MISRTVCLVALISAGLAACSPKGGTTTVAPAGTSASPTGLTEQSTVADVHKALIIPNANALFAAESEPPTTDAGWAALEAAASRVAEGAHLLQVGSRPRDHDGWLRIAGAVEQNAPKSAAAARAKDADALLLADGDFLVHCEDCHKTYRDPGGGMMANPEK